MVVESNMFAHIGSVISLGVPLSCSGVVPRAFCGRWATLIALGPLIII